MTTTKRLFRASSRRHRLGPFGLGLLLTTILLSAPLSGRAAVGAGEGAYFNAGEAIWLDEDKNRFRGFFIADQSGEPKGGVIILHDASRAINSVDVIGPLRQQLPRFGWPTLTIQLPPMGSINAYFQQQGTANRRINTAIEYMKSQGLANLVLLGHGTGAMTASAYLADQPDASIQGFVAISLGVLPRPDTDHNTPALIEKIKLPVLDIYGSRDLDTVVRSARQRSLAARSSSNQATQQNRLEPYMRSAQALSSQNKQQGYIAYRQIEIEGATHDFRGSEDILSKRILGWLERHAKGVEINRRQ